jgi:hypothetical protein
MSASVALHAESPTPSDSFDTIALLIVRRGSTIVSLDNRIVRRENGIAPLENWNCTAHNSERFRVDPISL